MCWDPILRLDVDDQKTLQATCGRKICRGKLSAGALA